MRGQGRQSFREGNPIESIALNTSMRLPVVKLLFRLRHPLLLQLSIELAAS